MLYSQEIGVLLTAIGAFFTFLGVLLLFDRGLLAIGNVCGFYWQSGLLHS